VSGGPSIADRELRDCKNQDANRPGKPQEAAKTESDAQMQWGLGNECEQPENSARTTKANKGGSDAVL
jgi:hypothetical protein